MTFKVRQKNGDYVRTALVPANHAQEPHFGAADCVILGLLVISLAGLIALLLP